VLELIFHPAQWTPAQPCAIAAAASSRRRQRYLNQNIHTEISGPEEASRCLGRPWCGGSACVPGFADQDCTSGSTVHVAGGIHGQSLAGRGLPGSGGCAVSRSQAGKSSGRMCCSSSPGC